MKQKKRFCVSELTDEEKENCPRSKFLKALAKSWKTPDFSYFFMNDGGVAGVGASRVLGVIQFDVAENKYFGWKWSLLNSIHIRSIGVADSQRGVGCFSTICATMLAVASDTGVFLEGVAKPFQYDIPELRSSEDCLAFIEDDKKGWDTLKRSKETDKRAILLKQKYLEFGFCSFDGSGYSASDKFWKKKCSFGFLGRQPVGEQEQHYFAKHLCCC